MEETNINNLNTNIIVFPLCFVYEDMGRCNSVSIASYMRIWEGE